MEAPEEFPNGSNTHRGNQMLKEEYAAGEGGARGLGPVNNNPLPLADEYWRLHDELSGCDPDDFGDTDEVFTQVAADICVGSQPIDLLRQFVGDIVLYVWPLIEDGVISTTRAMARLDQLARIYLVPKIAEEDCKRVIDCLLLMERRYRC
jgi:hypothetical protein